MGDRRRTEYERGELIFLLNLDWYTTASTWLSSTPDNTRKSKLVTRSAHEYPPQLTHHNWQPIAATDHSKTRKWRALFQSQPSSPPRTSWNKNRVPTALCTTWISDYRPLENQVCAICQGRKEIHSNWDHIQLGVSFPKTLLKKCPKTAAEPSGWRVNSRTNTYWLVRLGKLEASQLSGL